MTSNPELEERWVEAWNNLFDLVAPEDRWQVDCLLPDGSIVDFETCQSYLQDSAYADYFLRVQVTWVRGKHGVAVDRYKAGESQ
jgi:hypothetical protein